MNEGCCRVHQVPAAGEGNAAAVNQFHRAVKSNSKSGNAQADGAYGHAKYSMAISEAIPLRGPESGAVGEINTAGEGSQKLYVGEKRETGGCQSIITFLQIPELNTRSQTTCRR